MRSALRGVIAASLLAGAPAPSLARDLDDEGQHVPTAAELRQCPHLARVDWRRVARDLAAARRENPPAAAPADPYARHREIRGPWPLPDVSRAEIVIDIAIGSGETQEYPTSTSSFAWREPGGQWQVDRVDYVPSASLMPISPDAPPLMGEEAERARRPHTVGPLAQNQAEAIDRVLADPCFAIQPDYTPFQMPLRTGQIDSCYGAINSTVTIRRGSQVRAVSDICSRWPSAELANAVMYASISLGTTIEQAARARFPGSEIRITALREGRRTSIYPYYCGELDVGGGATPIMFQSTREGGIPRNELNIPGERNRWSGSFEETWRMFCANDEQPTAAQSQQ